MGWKSAYFETKVFQTGGFIQETDKWKTSLIDRISVLWCFVYVFFDSCSKSFQKNERWIKETSSIGKYIALGKSKFESGVLN